MCLACLTATVPSADSGEDGQKAAIYARDRMGEILKDCGPEVIAGPVPQLERVFQQVHNDLVSQESIDTYMSGTTAIVALVVDNTVHVANVGDGRLCVYKHDGSARTCTM